MWIENGCECCVAEEFNIIIHQHNQSHMSEVKLMRTRIFQLFYSIISSILLYMKGAKKSVCCKKFVCNCFLRPDLFRRPVTNSTHKVVTHSGKVVHTNKIHYYYCKNIVAVIAVYTNTID